MSQQRQQPDPRRSLAPAVTRAAAVLQLLAGDGRSLGTSELARRLGLAKSSVANICGALAEAGLIRRTDTGFALGRVLAELGAAYLSTVDQVQEFHQVCRDRPAGFEETIQLAVLDGALDVVYLARRDGSHPVHLASDIGRHLPATCTATGKAMLASLEPADLQARLDRAGFLPTLTRRSVATVEELLRELEKVRQQGYAVDDEETLEGVFCVAAGVPSSVVGEPSAVSFTLLKARAIDGRIRQLVEDVQTVAAELALRVGGARAPRHRS